jgi:hypothetical protein
MILDSISSTSTFPSEKINIRIRDIENVEDNTRFGLRFRHFYYNTNDSKLNFSTQPAYTIVSDDGSSSLSAWQPVNFLNPMDFNPFLWTVGNPNEYLYVSYNGGLSGVTIWPTHPYPSMSKISNTAIMISAMVALASGFDGEVKTPEYRTRVKNSGFYNLTAFPTYSTNSTGFTYASRGVKEFKIGENKNFQRNFQRKSLARNIINNSLKIEIPVVSSKTVLDDTQNQIFRLQFFDDNSSSERTSNGVKSTTTTLRTLTNTVLEDLGITFPYTTQANYNNATGAVNIVFKAPLFINKFDDITACYETSSVIPAPYNANTRIVNNSTNNFTVTSNIPVYFWNYRFRTASPGGIANTDAFTVNFTSSSFTISDNYSSVDVRTTMIDNYYQNQFSILSSEVAGLLVQRFVEENGELTLSAKPIGTNNVYITNQWMPAGYDLRFFNSGLGDRYSVIMQLSSFVGTIHQHPQPIDLLLNKRNIVFNLNLQESGETSAHCVATIFPTPAETGFGYKWAAHPPENVVFRNLEGDELSQNVLYENEFEAQVFNLGVDKTEIILYSQEYDTSASTFWFPPSSVVNNMYLELKGSVNDFNKITTGQVSAYCNRNGFSYRAPVDATIIWNEIGGDSRGELSFSTGANSPIKKGTTYASTEDYSIVDVAVSSIPVESYPHNILFDVSCDLFRSDFSMNASKLFFIREYPSKDYININSTVSSVAGSESVSSSAFKNKILTNSANISLSASYPDLIVDSSRLLWSIKNSNGATTLTSGNFASFSFNTVSACVTLSAISASPFEGNFKAYNFIESMCFYNLSSISPFNYIAFPENQYSPVKTLAEATNNYQCGLINQGFNLYNQSNGMTAYKSCHTENFYFSATPGFDRYIWKVGNLSKETNTNKLILPVTYANISASGSVSVSAFNSIFTNEDSVTVFNSTSSNGSNVYKQPITFFNFPTPLVNITINNNYYNINKYSETPKLTFEFDAGYTNIVGYTLNVVLSSSDFVQTKTIKDDRTIASSLLKIGLENSDFIIKENSVNSCIVYLSGNVDVTVDGFDYCSESKPISSNTLNLTAYNGPNIDLYALKNIVSAGEIVYLYNSSNSNFSPSNSSRFTSFIFNNGEGTIQTSTSAYLTARYVSEGAKSPSMTGILMSGSPVIQSWNSLIYVKNSFEPYDNTITRNFFQDISIPHSVEDVLVKPNEWQYASVINKSFQKIKTNLDYLSSSCSMNNITFPKAYGGFLGKKYGNFKWDTRNSSVNTGTNPLSDLKFVQYVDGKILVINGSNIEIYTFDETPELLFSFNRIGDGETLSNPVRLHYDSAANRLYILDSDKQLMFVCSFDIDSPNDIQLTHYWGGVGGKADRTKLNNPVDFCLDSLGNAYILDSDSMMIKVYNVNLNWIKNIDLTTLIGDKPLSLDCSNDIFCLTTETGTTYITNFNSIISKIQVSGATKSFFNLIHYGIIYIISGNKISKFMIDGAYVSDKTMSYPITHVGMDQYHVLISGKNCISKFVDFIEIDKIINDSESLSGFSWNSIFVDESELVADYVYNDSFKKIYDNINLLNKRVDSRIMVNYDEFGSVTSQYTSAISASALKYTPILLATNEPVLYDTINRSIRLIFDCLENLKDNISINTTVFNNNNNLQWLWKYHYIENTQKPSLNKNPVTWRELKSGKVSANTQLSSISAWYVLRRGVAGNHSEICWNHEYLQSNSYFPLEWFSTEKGSVSGHVFTWADFEKNCCVVPDFIFTDCVSSC